MAAINGIGFDANLGLGAPAANSLDKKPASFMESMQKAMAEVQEKHETAERSIQDLATGRRKTLHETMIAVEEAGISFKLMMAVRNKALSAYQEVMRMNF